MKEEQVGSSTQGRDGLSFVRTRCGLCQGDQHRELFSVAHVPVVQCQQCQHIYTLLQLRTPLDLYDNTYYHGVRRDVGSVAFRLAPEYRQQSERKTFAKRLKELEKRLGHKGRLLDVGCGLGEFLVVARDDGWEAEGIEPSEFASRFARDNYALPVYTGTLDNIPLPEESYDVVTLYDVIEHITQPRQLLLRAFPLLKSTGLLHLVTPNIRSFSARALGRHWYHIKPLEHCQYFSPDTLGRALDSAHFEMVEVRPSYDIVTAAYVLDRLRTYNQRLFGWLLATSLRFGGSRLRFSASFGEMEAWARKL